MSDYVLGSGYGDIVPLADYTDASALNIANTYRDIDAYADPMYHELVADFDAPLESAWYDNISRSDVAQGIGYAEIALSAYGTYTGLQEKATSYREQADLDDLRADEILRRSAITVTKIYKESRGTVAQQKTVMAGRGMSSTGTTALAIEADSLDEAYDEIRNVDAAANYDSYLAKASAAANRSAADAADKAGDMAIIGGALTIGATAIGGPGAGFVIGQAWDMGTN